MPGRRGRHRTGNRTDLHADVRADLHLGIGAGHVTGRVVPADQPGLRGGPGPDRQRQGQRLGDPLRQAVQSGARRDAPG